MRLQALTAWAIALTWATALVSAKNATTSGTTYPTKSGIKAWVDPDTPDDRQTYTSSRGRKWDLVMNDEFNVANRSFRPGDDHIWTSLEKPDGVNGALELYPHNMTSTKCDDDGTCYFYIEAIDEVNVIHVYNMYTHPPGYVDAYFFYRVAMVQSWNKFCFQGGMLEMRAQLPGAVSAASGNPDLAKGKNARAIFSASTNRMWPFSYDRCEPDVFDPENQRISACDDNPGYGMNPNQGRGAPEIDLLEGGGMAVSSSLQIAPGMPDDYRLFPVDTSTGDYVYCVYGYTCTTPGANYIDVPTAYYEKERGHKSWYQGLRYASNNFCQQDAAAKQSYATVAASLKNHWGINTNGTCYPLVNSYMGSYLCDPDNTNTKCASPRNESTTPKSNAMSSFNYQMDAISSNWPVHLGAYTDYVEYQIEWVTGKNGYVRWMLQGNPLFEVTTDAFSNVPQNAKKNNPQKVMLEEPMSLILNVALSSSWGATPPNAGKECRGDGTDEETNRICESFPMYLKIDYMRLYQDLGDDLDGDNYMQVGCDPKSHPTKEWIDGHIDEYEDDDNKWEEVAGKAFCSVDDDCTIGGNLGKTALKTGKCVKQRCQCTYASSWGGPRCTTAISSSSATSTSVSKSSYGPPMGLTGMIVLLSFISVYFSLFVVKTKSASEMKKNAAYDNDDGPKLSYSNAHGHGRPTDNYRQNFI
ncbi:hypothetical protein PHYSODRAFT_322750 [Phytophthora sojae]|uniref:Beta-glucan synthesis-associated protein n=1 Tax=Phytophthora sojae (strain P6497) TaxID=1094619 RepID=G4YKQ8_PHYSP|nr:hypothetical protein PHYSODRAFT_322750 [Phytophthora sojae]EGZ29212.1 hypothetical protein PHYSODRAFT_322750 [Phytophthora sojae]|eukprot:XP_009516487.1 hypothetical protein PHYSODRAFT_322750 [Phytophthora sojae]